MTTEWRDDVTIIISSGIDSLEISEADLPDLSFMLSMFFKNPESVLVTAPALLWDFIVFISISVYSINQWNKKIWYYTDRGSGCEGNLSSKCRLEGFEQVWQVLCQTSTKLQCFRVVCILQGSVWRKKTVHLYVNWLNTELHGVSMWGPLVGNFCSIINWHWGHSCVGKPIHQATITITQKQEATGFLLCCHWCQRSDQWLTIQHEKMSCSVTLSNKRNDYRQLLTHWN